MKESLKISLLCSYILSISCSLGYNSSLYMKKRKGEIFQKKNKIINRPNKKSNLLINNIKDPFILVNIFKKRNILNKRDLCEYILALKFILTQNFIRKNINSVSDIYMDIISTISRFVCLNKKIEISLNLTLGAQSIFNIKYDNNEVVNEDYINLINTRFHTKILFNRVINRQLSILYATCCEYYCPTCHEDCMEGKCVICDNSDVNIDDKTICTDMKKSIEKIPGGIFDFIIEQDMQEFVDAIAQKTEY